MEVKTTRHEVTHKRIVEIAARTLRRNGYAGVGVADVMKQAGLTHGGFYAHFKSRDELLDVAIKQARIDSSIRINQGIRNGCARGDSALRGLIESYLSELHLNEIENGCVVAALCSEAPRQSLDLVKSANESVNALIKTIQLALPKNSPSTNALAIASALVGGLQLARVLGHNAQGKAVLTATRNALLAQYDPE